MCFGSELAGEKISEEEETNWCAYETGVRRDTRNFRASSMLVDDVHSINRWKALCPGGEFTKRFFAGNVAERVGSTLFVHGACFRTRAYAVVREHQQDGREHNQRRKPEKARLTCNPGSAIAGVRDYAHTEEIIAWRCLRARRFLKRQGVGGYGRSLPMIQSAVVALPAACDEKCYEDVVQSRGCAETHEGGRFLTIGGTNIRTLLAIYSL